MKTSKERRGGHVIDWTAGVMMLVVWPPVMYGITRDVQISSGGAVAVAGLLTMNVIETLFAKRDRPHRKPRRNPLVVTWRVLKSYGRDAWRGLIDGIKGVLP